MTTEKYALLAATLANGGISPYTGEKIFLDPNSVKFCLSHMLSCGMNHYSGEWAFNIGLPAKSSVSGMTLLVVPNMMGIAVWSPKLNEWSNS